LGQNQCFYHKSLKSATREIDRIHLEIEKKGRAIADPAFELVPLCWRNIHPNLFAYSIVTSTLSEYRSLKSKDPFINKSTPK
jgi:hypothetical protein